jgi:membrane protease YdiL (CAAX protease family)
MNEAAVLPAREERRLVAPVWHTVVLISIFLAIAAYGAYAQSHAPAGDQLVQRRSSTVPLFLSLMAMQWGLLRFVVAGGLRRTGTSLRDLIGQRWSSWKAVAWDVVIALTVWALWTASTSLVEKALGSDAAKDISGLLPRDPAEIAAWVALSLTAGFCEEVIFRGYLQQQFRALTGSVVLGVLIQSVIFGVSHGYQGIRNVIMITIFGAVFGGLAVWRKSLKPGMVLHAWTDIFSGIFAAR